MLDANILCCQYPFNIDIFFKIKVCIQHQSKCSTIGNGNLFCSFSISWSIRLNLSDNIHALNDFSKHNVLSIKMWGWDSCDEELGSIGVGSSIGHWQQSWFGVFQFKVFIFPLYPNPFFPVQSSLKFCAVFGTTSSFNLKTILPNLAPSTLMSKKVLLIRYVCNLKIIRINKYWNYN